MFDHVINFACSSMGTTLTFSLSELLHRWKSHSLVCARDSEVIMNYNAVRQIDLTSQDILR
uniref:Uncharacterized protein n=1 Tax=Arundo donax TaxID=35708 RepID=A0A0A8ZWN3_ARUDO